MKKQTLLGAIALTTLAVGAAGAANAQQYSVIANATGGASVTAPTVMASEVALTATNSKGVIGFAVKPSATAILPTGNTILTVNLSGGHTFGIAVTPGAIVTNVGCAPTTVLTAGGAAGDNSVSFLLSSLGGCTNAVPITVALPVQLANNTSSLGINTTFKTEFGTNIDGGSGSYSNGSSPFTAIPVVSFAKAFTVTAVADTAVSAATLASGFKSLSEGVLGTVAVAANTAAKLGIQAGAGNVAQSDITNAAYKFVGSQSTTAASLLLNAVTVPAATGQIAIANPAATAFAVTAIPVTPTQSTAVIPASTYTVAVDLTLGSGFTAQPTFGPSALQSITREGTTYLIPWASSGTLAGTTGNSTVIRIANIGATATGAVSAELLTSSTGTAKSTALVPLATSIAIGGELVITGQSLQTAIGSNFGRGDVRLTVEAQPATLITRRFIQNVTSSALTEVSMGRDVFGVEPQN